MSTCAPYIFAVNRPRGRCRHRVAEKLSTSHRSPPSKRGTMSVAMAREWAPYHINVNAIGPGTFPTELTEPLYTDPQRTSAIIQRIPMGRPGLPDDLAGATLFLASKASDYITGHVLYVDGGWLIT